MRLDEHCSLLFSVNGGDWRNASPRNDLEDDAADEERLRNELEAARREARAQAVSIWSAKAICEAQALNEKAEAAAAAAKEAADVREKAEAAARAKAAGKSPAKSPPKHQRAAAKGKEDPGLLLEAERLKMRNKEAAAAAAEKAAAALVTKEKQRWLDALALTQAAAEEESLAGIKANAKGRPDRNLLSQRVAQQGLQLYIHLNESVVCVHYEPAAVMVSRLMRSVESGHQQSAYRIC